MDPQFFSSFVIPHPDKCHAFILVRNITALKQTIEKLARHEAELKRLTFIDHLTQLNNRYAMDQLLPVALDDAFYQQTSCALFMIDIDRFKQYNDTFGHIKGDEALRKLSRSIQGWKRKNDLCFRYGGDEFLVFISGISRQQCENKAYQLLNRIQRLLIINPKTEGDVNSYLSITIGVRYSDKFEQPVTLKQLIYAADQALFYAKNHQRGTVHIQEDNLRSSFSHAASS